MVHGCWQLDVNERVPLPGYGLAHILDLVDHHSGLKLAAVPFPAQEPRDRVRVTWAQYRQALRAAFSRWGLPDRHPPLLVYPEARQPRCFYRLEDELALFDEQRVQAYRAQGSWLRRTADKGRFSLGGHYVNLTTAYRQRWVRITYRCCAVGFQATCPPEPTVLKTFQLPGLSAADLTGLE